MIDIKKCLYEIREDEHVFEEDIDLVESGLLDSYALIQLLSKLEDSGIELHPTRIDRTKLRTVKVIVELIEEYYKQASKK